LEQGITRDIEYDFLKADGTSFPGETSAAVVRDATGAPSALMALVRDITARKQAEENIKKEQERLRRMLRASDRDRQLITYEIHDGVSQRLVGALMHLQAFQRSADWKSKVAKNQLEAGLHALREASGEARRLMNRTHTSVLDKYGLSAAIADLIDHVMEMPDAPEITYNSDVKVERLVPVLENALYRVAQEAIANAVLHSKSESVRVTLKQVDQDVVLEVQDWGIGFSEADVKEDRYGLAGIRERARLLGKGVVVESTPGVGTYIRAIFPMLEADQQNGSLKDNSS
jgi:signal transduction histidine kinase